MEIDDYIQYKKDFEENLKRWTIEDATNERKIVLKRIVIPKEGKPAKTAARNNIIRKQK
jgi:hypothetical protein